MELLTHRVKRIECYLPSLGSFLSHVLRGGGKEREVQSSNNPLALAFYDR